MKHSIIISLLCLLMSSCAPTPEAIEYGSDVCHYCKMTIVDRQHASEVVTKKGRVYKFDAIECMIPYILQEQEDQFSHVLVSDYSDPGSLIDASGSYFLVSESIPSPMGGFLSAVDDEAAATHLASSKGGEIYTWSSIKQKY